MLYKNSIKIVFSNFEIVWKSLLYHLLIGAISVFFMYLCINPIYELLESVGFIGNIVDIYTDFVTSLNLTELFADINVLNLQFVDILTNNISSIWINILGLVFTIFVFHVIMSNLSIMASCNSLHYYMGSMNKQGFYFSFKDIFAKNLKVQLCYFIVSLPIKATIFGFFTLCLNLFSYSFWISVLAIFLIVMGFVLLTALKYTLFAAWIPTMVVMNYGVFKSLKVGVKTTFRKSGRVYANAIGIVLTIVLLNFVVGLFTFSVGLLITIPVSYLLYSAFGMVTVYEGQGMRYYVDVYNVITPQKKETSDKFADMKYIV